VGDIRAAMESAIRYLEEHPEEARYTDSPATARLDEGLRFRVEGPDGEEVVTDMPGSVGGEGSAPSPGWLFRAALSSCVGTLVAMRAAQEQIQLDLLEVTVDSESDDRGLLGMESSVPAGPLSIGVRIRVASPNATEEQLRAISEWGKAHCPVCDAAERSVPTSLQITTR
jgi:uncharacterized OsmC-like protein